jgi:type I restriction enzyme S subunit
MPKLSLNASKKTKHTPAGEIPVDWASCKIGNLCTLSNGTGFGPKDWKEEGWPIIRIQNLNGNSNFNYFGGIPNESWIVEPGDLLFAWAGTRGASFGPTIWNGPRGVLNQHIFKIQASSHIDKTWLYLNLRILTENIEKKAHGFKSTLLHVGKKDITGQTVPVPPLPEQRRIAVILATWDRAIETLESLIAAKERRKQALMEQLLSGRKRLPGFTGKWPTTHLGKLAENVSIRNNGKLGWDRLYAVTKANGMIPMREQVMGISTNNCKLVKRDDFAYNPMRLNIGSLARWQGDEDVMVSGDYIVFRCNEGELDPRYFNHLRRSEHWNQFVNVGGSGSVRVRLYFKDIAPFQIRCPSFKEQQAIAAVLDTADRELTLHRQHLATLRTQKRGLMGKLLTGAIRIPNK